MTLTPQQRLEAYEWAMGRIAECAIEDCFLCCVLFEYIDNELGFYYLEFRSFLDLFPEILKQKPNKNIAFYNGWYPENESGRLQRLAALDRAIELVKEKI